MYDGSLLKREYLLKETYREDTMEGGREREKERGEVPIWKRGRELMTQRVSKSQLDIRNLEVH